MEMMKMAVWCPRLTMYLLLRLRSRVGALPHLQQQTQIKGKVASRREPPRRVQVDHPSSRIIGDTKDIRHALSNHNWVNSMHEELVLVVALNSF
jgi:hypothetical protein